MRDGAQWGAHTISTGLGNARFTNRKKDDCRGGNGGKEAGKDEKGRAVTLTG